MKCWNVDLANLFFKLSNHSFPNSRWECWNQIKYLCLCGHNICNVQNIYLRYTWWQQPTTLSVVSRWSHYEGCPESWTYRRIRENKLGFFHGNSEKDDWKDLPLSVVDKSGEDDDKDGEAQEPDGELLGRGPHGLHQELEARKVSS